jgi:hypothetical protein
VSQCTRSKIIVAKNLNLKAEMYKHMCQPGQNAKSRVLRLDVALLYSEPMVNTHTEVPGTVNVSYL